MPFCVNCGNENPVGVRFCSKCGAEQVTGLANCSKCGKTLEENEKFCSACGTPVAGVVESKPESKSKKDKFTPEGRKIISGGPKPDHVKSQSTPPPKPPPAFPKKKKGCLGCLGKSLLIILVLLIIGVVIIWNLPDDEGDKLTDTDIPGIVDIEPGDKNNQGMADSGETDRQIAKPGKENKDVKKTAKRVEDIFAKSDTLKLKELLSEKSLATYAGVFDDIYPHMPAYAKAFKNRKLKISKNALSVYEFKDETGDTFCVTFEMQADGKWKLINF